MRISLFLFLSLCLTPLFAQDAEYLTELEQHREAYKADFLTESHSPFFKNKEGLQHLQFYTADTNYRVMAHFTATPDEQPFDMATYSGVTRKYVKYGTLEFTLRDSTWTLAIYQSLRLRKTEEYKDYLFLPFKDWSNGETTYGGGRYLDIRMGEIEEGKMILDFNKVYNPYCAFKDGYSCPIPPRENHLETHINAGEKAYPKH